MRRFCLIPVLVLFAAGALLQAALTPQDEKEVLNHKLTMPLATKIIAALPEVTQLVLSAPDARERLIKASRASLEERVKDAENSPKTVELLKRHGLTPREYVVGVVTLRMALTAASLPPRFAAEQPGGRIAAECRVRQSALSELKPKMDAADRAGVPRGR